MKTLRQRLSTVRGLKFTADVPIFFKPRESIETYLKAASQQDQVEDQKQGNVSLAYAKLGLLPQGVSLRNRLLGYYSAQSLGFYDSFSKRIILMQEEHDLARSHQSSLSKEKVTNTLIHEFTHALQDQHFALAANLRQPGNGDRVLALRSVAEADAILSEYAYAFGGLYGWVADYARQRFKPSTEELGLSGVPPLLMDRVRFQYTDGLRFVSRFVGNHGWLPINLLHKYPPLSTEQVLHPEKYFLLPDPPTAIKLDDLAALFASPWSQIENDTLGELAVKSLFKQFLGAAEAGVVANGWDGDRFIAYRRGDEVAFIWATVWDSSGDAQEFFERYQTVVSKKRGMSSSRDPHPYIEKRDRLVLVVEGLEAKHVERQIERIWLTMETQEESFQPPPLTGLASFR